MTIARSNTVQESSLQVNLATQPWEKQAVYKLRYEIYVQEMAKPLGAIVNKRKQISDALDDQSNLIYVQSGNEIVATMRLTIAPAKNYPADLAEVFQMHKCQTLFGNQPQPIFGLGTKLAVKAEYRNTAATYLIIAEGYRLLREHNVQICFTGCNPYLIPLYERLGFRKF
ncbi:MAG: GNAT family N-acyltransferase, partial [Bacteroidota bacterium]|nr:GNAT family N-acyltransferase [Bacteroidota bacterium]